MEIASLIALIATIIFGVPATLVLYYRVDKKTQGDLSNKEFVVRSLIFTFIGISLVLALFFLLNAPGNTEPKPETPIATDAPTESPAPMPLIQCTFLSDSNDGSSDVCVGSWTDKFGTVYPDSIRFWVVKGPGYAETESTTYQVNGEYSTLSGVIVPASNSASGSKFVVSIYLDGNLAYQSPGLSDTSNPQPYSIDVRNGNKIRIVCTTSTSCYGYCIVSAELV